jgi:hypothetical protein
MYIYYILYTEKPARQLGQNEPRPSTELYGEWNIPASFEVGPTRTLLTVLDMMGYKPGMTEARMGSKRTRHVEI